MRALRKIAANFGQKEDNANAQQQWCDGVGVASTVILSVLGTVCFAFRGGFVLRS